MDELITVQGIMTSVWRSWFNTRCRRQTQGRIFKPCIHSVCSCGSCGGGRCSAEASQIQWLSQVARAQRLETLQISHTATTDNLEILGSVFKVFPACQKAVRNNKNKAVLQFFFFQMNQEKSHESDSLPLWLPWDVLLLLPGRPWNRGIFKIQDNVFILTQRLPMAQSRLQCDTLGFSHSRNLFGHKWATRFKSWLSRGPSDLGGEGGAQDLLASPWKQQPSS